MVEKVITIDSESTRFRVDQTVVRSPTQILSW